MIPRTGSRQTRRKRRFQSMAASSAMVPASARKTWMVDPSGPVCMVAVSFMANGPPLPALGPTLRRTCRRV